MAAADAARQGARRSARLSVGRAEVVTYAGGERVVVRRGGAGTAPMQVEGADDGDTMVTEE